MLVTVEQIRNTRISSKLTDSGSTSQRNQAGRWVCEGRHFVSHGSGFRSRVTPLLPSGMGRCLCGCATGIHFIMFVDKVLTGVSCLRCCGMRFLWLCSLGAGTSSVYAGLLSEVLGHAALELYERPWFPSRSRGKDGDGCAPSMCLLFVLLQTLSPLCPCTDMCSRRSSGPQPMGSGGDATPCKVTREDRGLYLLMKRRPFKGS